MSYTREDALDDCERYDASDEYEDDVKCLNCGECYYCGTIPASRYQPSEPRNPTCPSCGDEDFVEIESEQPEVIINIDYDRSSGQYQGHLELKARSEYTVGPKAQYGRYGVETDFDAEDSTYLGCLRKLVAQTDFIGLIA
jgi:hypothetical protein